MDDNKDLNGRIMGGLQVYGSDRLDYMLRDTDAQQILLALLSALRARRRQIRDTLTPYAIPVRTLPGMMALASGLVQDEALREVRIDDLLERAPVAHNPTPTARCLHETTVSQ